jgi:prolipoprotein diacylglyceryltransferase
MESAGGLIIALIVLYVGSRKNIFTGLQFYLVGLFYAVLRFFVDYTRFYSDGERLAGLSHNQVICIILFVIFAGLILKNFLFKELSVKSSENLIPDNSSDEPEKSTILDQK